MDTQLPVPFPPQPSPTSTLLARLRSARALLLVCPSLPVPLLLAQVFLALPPLPSAPSLPSACLSPAVLRHIPTKANFVVGWCRGCTPPANVLHVSCTCTSLPTAWLDLAPWQHGAAASSPLRDRYLQRVRVSQGSGVRLPFPQPLVWSLRAQRSVRHCQIDV